jgi:acetoin utilization protein AcuC
MSVALVFDPTMAEYDLGPMHPLRPERVTLTIDLMRAYGLLAKTGDSSHRHERPDNENGALGASVIPPLELAESDLELVHDTAYIETVKDASADPQGFRPRRGIGPGDTPAFVGMHEASLLICGGTAAAVDAVMDGTYTRAFAVAGGLHHAHRDRAAGFCVYNDPAVAIARATRDHPGLRVAYIDIDAHHGDGVQEAFEERADVLTLSLHETGLYLFPGTGFAVDIGTGTGQGYALNLPMPPGADDACYELAFEQVVEPCVSAFRPDVIVGQLGADAHRDDPLTQLGLSISGHQALVRRILELADVLCSGRLAATGGGGYDTFSAVPRIWTCALGEMLDATIPEELPESWRDAVGRISERPVPKALHEEHTENHSSAVRVGLLTETERVVARVRQMSPLLSG